MHYYQDDLVQRELERHRAAAVKRVMWAVGAAIVTTVARFAIRKGARSLIYCPTVQVNRARALPTGVERLPVPGVTHQDTWWLPLGRRGAPTVLFFHGNAGCLFDRAPVLRRMRDELQVNVCAVDYAGYGCASGEPCETTLVHEAARTVATLRNRLDIGPLFVYGRSLGGAVAVAAVKAVPDVAGLILESTFTSTGDVAGLPAVNPLIDSWHSLSRIRFISVPILFITASEDRLVNVSHSSKLRAAATLAPATSSFTIRGAGHNESGWTVDPHAYRAALRRFIGR